MSHSGVSVGNQSNRFTLTSDDGSPCFWSSGPSELDLSLLGETSALADVAYKYSEVRGP